MGNVLKRKSNNFVFTALKSLNIYDFVGNEKPLWKEGSTIGVKKDKGIYKVVNIDGFSADYRITVAQLHNTNLLKLETQW